MSTREFRRWYRNLREKDIKKICHKQFKVDRYLDRLRECNRIEPVLSSERLEEILKKLNSGNPMEITNGMKDILSELEAYKCKIGYKKTEFSSPLENGPNDSNSEDSEDPKEPDDHDRDDREDKEDKEDKDEIESEYIKYIKSVESRDKTEYLINLIRSNKKLDEDPGILGDTEKGNQDNLGTPEIPKLLCSKIQLYETAVNYHDDSVLDSSRTDTSNGSEYGSMPNSISGSPMISPASSTISSPSTNPQRRPELISIMSPMACSPRSPLSPLRKFIIPPSTIVKRVETSRLKDTPPPPRPASSNS